MKNFLENDLEIDVVNQDNELIELIKKLKYIGLVFHVKIKIKYGRI